MNLNSTVRLFNRGMLEYGFKFEKQCMSFGLLETRDGANELRFGFRDHNNISSDL